MSEIDRQSYSTVVGIGGTSRVPGSPGCSQPLGAAGTGGCTEPSSGNPSLQNTTDLLLLRNTGCKQPFYPVMDVGPHSGPYVGVQSSRMTDTATALTGLL